MNNGITDRFDPIKAINTLRDNAVEIERLGEKIHAKRLQLVTALAELMDSEEQARIKVFQMLESRELTISMSRDFIKLRTAKEQKNHDIIKEELRILEDQRDIIIEVNNALKASFKIHELEARNLNLN